MSYSQTVKFAGYEEPDAEFDHPAGLSVMKCLIQGLKESNWTIGELENWRDAGWSFTCFDANSRVEVLIVSMGTDQWMLHISPEKCPGIFGKALGRLPSASRKDIARVAETVCEMLKRIGSFHDFMWRWDGEPNSKNSTPEPLPPAT